MLTVQGSGLASTDRMVFVQPSRPVGLAGGYDHQSVTHLHSRGLPDTNKFPCIANQQLLSEGILKDAKEAPQLRAIILL